jgi:amino acid permease
MTLLIILACVFGAVALMVILGERFGKPMSDKQQAKFSKTTWVLVFMILLAAIVREMF